nr:short-chain dehydrogenase/reductase [Verrucomicrobium spinosum]
MLPHRGSVLELCSRSTLPQCCFTILTRKAAFFIIQEAGRKLNDHGKIVPTVLHLVSDGWWITGQTIFSNGGYTTR